MTLSNVRLWAISTNFALICKIVMQFSWEVCWFNWKLIFLASKKFTSYILMSKIVWRRNKGAENIVKVKVTIIKYCRIFKLQSILFGWRKFYLNEKRRNYLNFLFGFEKVCKIFSSPLSSSIIRSKIILTKQNVICEEPTNVLLTYCVLKSILLYLN